MRIDHSFLPLSGSLAVSLISVHPLFFLGSRIGRVGANPISRFTAYRLVRPCLLPSAAVVVGVFFNAWYDGLCSEMSALFSAACLWNKRFLLVMRLAVEVRAFFGCIKVYPCACNGISTALQLAGCLESV